MRTGPSRQRRFRAIAIWALAGIGLFQLGLGWMIESARPEVRDPEFVHREQLLQGRLTENDGRPVVMVLGSSRVQNGVDAASASRALGDDAMVFNFGIPNSGPYLERICLERLQARRLKPDVLLIEVFAPHYNAKRSLLDLHDLNGERLSAHELTEMPATFDTLAHPGWRWLIARAAPTSRHQAELRAWLGLDEARKGALDHPELRTIDRLGWQPRAFPADQCSVLKHLAHVQYDPSYGAFELCPIQVRLLEQMLRNCRKQGVRAALLLMPEGSEFRRLWSPSMTAAIDGMIADLKHRYGVAVIDARTWIADEFFIDMHHLRWDGAGYFSQRLARESIRPLLRDHALADRGGHGH
jgi:hypothetical protein